MQSEQIHYLETPYSAKNVAEVAGLSYRQLNDWENKGVMPSKRGSESGWRKFSPRDVFVIMICSEIHEQFGTPLESLGYIKRMMLQPKANHLFAAVEMMDYGLTPYLMTNLKDHFMMQSSDELGKYICQTFSTDSEETDTYILLGLRPIVKRLLLYIQKIQGKKNET